MAAILPHHDTRHIRWVNYDRGREFTATDILKNHLGPADGSNDNGDRKNEILMLQGVLSEMLFTIYILHYFAKKIPQFQSRNVEY